jgi:hypothetical protein
VEHPRPSAPGLTIPFNQLGLRYLNVAHGTGARKEAILLQGTFGRTNKGVAWRHRDIARITWEADPGLASASMTNLKNFRRKKPVI